MLRGAKRVPASPKFLRLITFTLMQMVNLLKTLELRFTICHEHACAACPTHVCCCIWRKRVYVIANKGFSLGAGQAMLRSPRRRNASRDGLVKLGWVHCLQYVNCFQYNVCDLCRCKRSNRFCIYICDIKFFGCTVCFNLTIARNWAMPSSKSYDIFHLAPIKLFSKKVPS